jgi:hypothetical protein
MVRLCDEMGVISEVSSTTHYLLSPRHTLSYLTLLHLTLPHSRPVLLYLPLPSLPLISVTLTCLPSPCLSLSPLLSCLLLSSPLLSCLLRLIMTAAVSFSYASPLDHMHPLRPLRSLFHPAIFLSILGQAAIHIGNAQDDSVLLLLLSHPLPSLPTLLP